MAEKIKNWMQKPVVNIVIFAVVAVAMILVSFLVLYIPLVAVCTIVILEGALAALLNRIPLWIHGLIVIAQVVAGILFGKIVFMALMAVVYVAAVALLYLWTAKDNA